MPIFLAVNHEWKKTSTSKSSLQPVLAVRTYHASRCFSESHINIATKGFWVRRRGDCGFVKDAGADEFERFLHVNLQSNMLQPLRSSMLYVIPRVRVE